MADRGKTLRLSEAIIWAVAQDAGNRSMRRAGRSAWNDDDRNVACAEFQRLAAIHDAA